MGKQIWVSDWIRDHISLPTRVSRFQKGFKEYEIKFNKQMDKRKNFSYWMKWWDSSYNGTGTYDDDVLASNLGYAIVDLENGVIR